MSKKIPDRWEHGSDFHWLDFESLGVKAVHPWSGVPTVKYGSGRDALRALLAHGAEASGWKRIFVPSFFCQHVVAAMQRQGMELATYHDAPGEAPVWPNDLRQGDVLLVVNFFGLREEVDSSEPRGKGALVVEDHTHDPWSPWARSSKADYCVVALRKSLPVPEGGVVWSPRSRTLPEEPVVSGERQLAADTKRAGMLLKQLYMAGHAVAKEDFRVMLVDGEKRIASGVIAGMTSATRAVLDCLPVDDWRERRRRNFQALAEALEQTGGVRLLQPEGRDCVPFNATLVADTPDQRETLRRGLITRWIYPAILWSLENPVLDGISAEHVQLSKRILSLHCDSRYSEEDLIHVAYNVAEVINGSP